MMPTKELSQHDLQGRLRKYIDRLRDPEYRIVDPLAFAQDYHVLVTLAVGHREKLFSKHVTHNLGSARMKILNDLLEQAGQEHIWEEGTA